MPDFDGVHDFDDVGSLLEHNDCGQPMLMSFQSTTKYTHNSNTTLYRYSDTIDNQRRLTELFSLSHELLF